MHLHLTMVHNEKEVWSSLKETPLRWKLDIWTCPVWPIIIRANQGGLTIFTQPISLEIGMYYGLKDGPIVAQDIGSILLFSVPNQTTFEVGVANTHNSMLLCYLIDVEWWMDLTF